MPSHTWVATGRLRQRTRLAADEEFAKLKLVADVARATWGPND